MNKGKSWLGESNFNMLVDYYTEIPFRPYGSGATRENILPFLKELNLGYICIYAKGHSGFTTWPGSLGAEHPMLSKDMPGFFRSVTREADTKLVLYYSGLLDGVAGERHPEWRMCDREGKPNPGLFADFKSFVSYAICPQSGYWDQWVAVQLRELIENYDPDGVWVDGDWPGPCYCPRCRAVFLEASGWSGPWDALRERPDFAAAYARSWNLITHQWRSRFNAFIKSLKPDCVYSAGNVSPRREFLGPFDWRSGDFFSPALFRLHDISRMMRWYSMLGVPYDAYVCDTSFTHARKDVRSRTKSLDRMLQEAAVVAANGGTVGYWTYPLGNGALVPSRMKKAAAVRRFLDDRRDTFRFTESVHWTAILVSDPASPTFGGPCVSGAHKALAALHRSPDVMDETGVSEKMPYDLIVLPEQSFVDSNTAGRLAAFVSEGGSLLTSGSSIRSGEIRELLGVDEVVYGRAADGHVRLRRDDEPSGVDSAWDKLTLRDGEELYPLYLSWDQFNPRLDSLTNNWPMHGQLDEEHPEPAGFAAAVMRRYGLGRIIHICTDIFAVYDRLGDPQMLRWLREIVDELQPDPFFRTDAPSWVDISLRCRADQLLIHFVNQNPGRDLVKLHADDLWVDEIPSVGPIAVRVRRAVRPREVRWEPYRTPVEWSFEDGVLSAQIPKLEIHGCLVVDHSGYVPSGA